MAMVLTCKIDLDSLVWRDQAKALNAMAELEDLGNKHKIDFDWREERTSLAAILEAAKAVEIAKAMEAEKVKAASPTAPQPDPAPPPEPAISLELDKATGLQGAVWETSAPTETAIPMPAPVSLDSAEVRILKSVAKLKRATFRQIQEDTELVTGTLSPNLSRLVMAGKLEKHSPAGAGKKTSRDAIYYTLAK